MCMSSIDGRTCTSLAARTYTPPRDVDTFDKGEFLSFAEGKIARYKLPKAVWVVDELPRTAAGKVLKRQLRDGAADR